MKTFFLGLIVLVALETAAQQAIVRVAKVPGVSISAFTASEEECGKDDGVTASGVLVHDGVVACNFLPFGTKIRIPSMYGRKIFTVYCRLAKDNMNNIDIYTKYVPTALQIGRHTCMIEVLS